VIVLDTNVVSEIFRPEPEPRVVTWLEGLTGEVAITAVTLAELLAGVRRLPEGQRRSALAERLDLALEPYRATRAILPFDGAAAEQYADVLAARGRAGRPIRSADAQLAAICRAHGAACATRDVQDFDGTGVDVVNPWTA